MIAGPVSNRTHCSRQLWQLWLDFKSKAFIHTPSVVHCDASLRHFPVVSMACINQRNASVRGRPLSGWRGVQRLSRPIQQCVKELINGRAFKFECSSGVSAAELAWAGTDLDRSSTRRLLGGGCAENALERSHLSRRNRDDGDPSNWSLAGV